MKIENLIRYWDKVLDGYKEDERSQKKHFKMIGEALRCHVTFLDIESKVKPNRYDEVTELYFGDCSKCGYFVNSEWDFCPKCGHPLRFQNMTKGQAKVHSTRTQKK